MATQTKEDKKNRGKQIVKTILFPTDFSPHAHNAFEYALHLAGQWDARLVLFHAYHYAAVGEYFITPELIDTVNLHRRDLADTELKKYGEKVTAKTESEVEIIYKLEMGLAVDEIKRIAATEPIDMIIMGTRGAGNTVEKILGSVTSQVIEHVRCPVLAIPEKAVYQPIGHILYATNFEEPDFELPDAMIRLIRKMEAKVSFVHINQNPDDPWTRLQVSLREEIFSMGLDPEMMDFFVMDNANVWEGLQAFISTHQVDMLATLTHKHGFWERLLRKSLTRKAALNLDIPLLAFHQ